MSSDVRDLYERLRSKPFPALGRQIGDFPLYDALVAGCANRAARGEEVTEPEVPVPDEGTLRYVADMRKRPVQSQEEQAFLEYFELLEDICRALQQRYVH